MHAPDADRVCVKHGAASLFYVYRVRGGIHTLKDLSAGDADGGTEGAGAGRDGRGEMLNKYTETNEGNRQPMKTSRMTIINPVMNN